MKPIYSEYEMALNTAILKWIDEPTSKNIYEDYNLIMKAKDKMLEQENVQSLEIFEANNFCEVSFTDYTFIAKDTHEEREGNKWEGSDNTLSKAVARAIGQYLKI